MSALYNEFEPYAAEWTRNLMAAGHIAPGEVDERSIKELAPSDVSRHTQAHFFSGIAVWSYALRLAGVPDDFPVWTASCPCQPFSSAGQRRGLDDDRHLWPTLFTLVDRLRPSILFGEQVASKDGLAWLDAVHDDLEGAGYSVGAFDLPACSAGAPHLRQRLYFVAVAGGSAREHLRVPLKRWRAGRLADTASDGRQERSAARLHDHGQGWHDAPRRGATRASGPAATRAMGDAGVDGARQYHRELHSDEGQHEVRAPDSDHASIAAGAARSATGGLGDAERARLEGGRARGPAIDADGARGPANGFWANAVWLPCRDGKSRAVWGRCAPTETPLSLRKRRDSSRTP